MFCWEAFLQKAYTVSFFYARVKKFKKFLCTQF